MFEVLPDKPSEKALRWFIEKFKEDGPARYERHFGGPSTLEAEPEVESEVEPKAETKPKAKKPNK